MARLLLFNKPYRVLSQFGQPRDGLSELHAGAVNRVRATLADFIDAPDCYPAGRLDYHSEGLMLLTDDGALQARISSPDTKTWKRYWVQVEGEASEKHLQQLRRGVRLKDGTTRPARADKLAGEPQLWRREPPVSPRRAARSDWLDIAICEGRNRQLRRMCAAVGLPVLRLVRYRIGHWTLGTLAPGECSASDVHLPHSNSTRRRAKPRRP